MSSYLIAYWAKQRDVLWTFGDHPNVEHDTLYARMQSYICEGHIPEILEYVCDSDGTAINKRCIWWREQLRAQGYDIGREKVDE